MGFSKQNTGVGCHALLQGVFPTQGLNPSMSPALQVDYLPLNHLGSPSEQREEQRQSRPFYLEPTLSTHPLFHPEFISNKDEWPNIWGEKRDRIFILRNTKNDYFIYGELSSWGLPNRTQKVLAMDRSRWILHTNLRCVLQTTQPEHPQCNFLCPDKNVMCKLMYHLPVLLSHDFGYYGIIFRVRQ